MKKALAVLLAVMMLATLAFAMTLIDVVHPGGPGELPTLEIDPNETDFALKISANYFKKVRDVEINKKNFSVEGLEGLGGKFVKIGSDEVYVIPLVDKKVPWDGKADLNIGSFTVRYIGGGATGTYINYEADGGEIVAKSGKLNGIALKSDEINAVNTGIAYKLAPAYDVGYAVNKIDSATGLISGKWYKNITDHELVWSSFGGYSVLTLKVPAKGIFYYEYTYISTPAAVGSGSPPTGTFTPEFPYAMKVKGDASLAYELPSSKGCNERFYAVDEDGNVYNAGLTWTVTKNSVGEESGAWTLTTQDYPYGIFTNSLKLTVKDIPTAKAPADPKNPPTGANDVVGVAAALAVVALVSGAAISLKK